MSDTPVSPGQDTAAPAATGPTRDNLEAVATLIGVAQDERLPISLWKPWAGPRAGRLTVGGHECAVHGKIIDEELARMVMGTGEIWRRLDDGESPQSIADLAATRR